MSVLKGFGFLGRLNIRPFPLFYSSFDEGQNERPDTSKVAKFLSERSKASEGRAHQSHY